MIQAMCIASVCELVGAVLAGARVSGTIKNDIIPTDAFAGTPSVLMLGMLCALVGSSRWLTLATKVSAEMGSENDLGLTSDRSVSQSPPHTRLLAAL